jgi:hypothetical protein
MNELWCECSDPGCRECYGHCVKVKTTTLYRVDMEDLTGCLFCEGCAHDAMNSGVFTDEDPNAPSEDW